MGAVMSSMETREIAKRILKRSTRILSTDTGAERDRYGDAVMEVKISATKMGGRCLIIYHAINGDCLIVDNVRNSGLLEAALNAHRADYGDAEVWVSVDDAADLPNRILSVGSLLDANYQPTDGVPESRPSEILNAITGSDEAESDPHWAWFGSTLFLTESVRKRTGAYKCRLFFDESSIELLKGLQFNVERYEPRNLKYPQGLTLGARIRVSKRHDAIVDCIRSIEKREREALGLQQRIGHLEKEIAALKSSLPELREAFDQTLKHESYPESPVGMQPNA